MVQVIIKKFELPCPLSEDALNETITKVFNTSLSQLNTSADVCTPKYFVFNSQVKIEGKASPADGNVSVVFEAQFRLCCVFQTIYAVPILTFAFVCHPSILPMYEELKEWVHVLHLIPDFKGINTHWYKKVPLTETSVCLPPTQPFSQEDAGRRQHVLPGHVHHVPAGCPVWISDIQWWVGRSLFIILIHGKLLNLIQGLLRKVVRRPPDAAEWRPALFVFLLSVT